MFDVFYSGPKPNQFAHEQAADSIEHAQRLSRTEYFWWITYLADYSKFNFLYVPPPWQAEYTHVWPSQHHEYSGTYLVPRSGEIKYHFHDRVVPNRHSLDHYRVLHQSTFDFTWAPHPHDPPYIYVFGNQWWPATVMPTVEYHVPGATERKYMNTQAQLPERHDNHWHTLIDCNWDYSWVPDPGDPPYIYVFGNQWWSAEKMPTVEYHVPGATERKYMSWPRAGLLPDRSAWTVPDSVDVGDFDFSWVPDPGAPPYIYQFATQHQKTGGPVYTVPGAAEVKYLSEIKTRTTRVATATYEIDHMDGAAGQIPNVTRRVRYFDNYRDTLIRLAKSIGTEHEYVWVCSSICDYTDFDFSWHPEAWQSTMLHVFASNEQKFGDTFFMHVPTFAESAEKKALLDWYDVNYVPNISVPRRSMPVVFHNNDTHVEAVKTQDWAGPLALFTVDTVPNTLPTVSLWRQETKNIVPLSAGASAVIVPKTAQGNIKTQLYDHPYIDKTQRKRHSELPLDVVFISNGEPNAETNWGIVSSALAYKPNKLHRVSNVNGRVAAYHAAAQASTTPWFFAVFAKLAVNPQFDWSWQPDRMQQPKHYIFHARNPVNSLEYGHQAMIAYNRQLTLNNPGVGLDFTLDSAHEVVPFMSGTAYYSYTPWMAWRTAFREVLKLCASTDVESQYRLKQWLDTDTNGLVDNEEWSVYGAEDAVEYYDSVNGDFEQLRKSYDWVWLASYAMLRRNLTPD
jgi:hypothetical protein